MHLQLITLLTFFVLFIELCLVVIIFLGSKTYSSRTFTVFALSHIIWGATLAILQGVVHDPQNAELLFRITFLEGLAVSIIFFYFTLVYPDSTKPPYWTLAVLLVFFAPIFVKTIERIDV